MEKKRTGIFSIVVLFFFLNDLTIWRSAKYLRGEAVNRLIENDQAAQPGQGHTEEIAQQSQEESAELAVQTQGSGALRGHMPFSSRRPGTICP